MKKSILAISLLVTLLFVQFLLPANSAVAEAGSKSYFLDYSKTDPLADWSGDKSSGLFRVETDRIVNGSAAWSSITYMGADYTDFDLTVTVGAYGEKSGAARIAFQVGEVDGVVNRYYLHLDYKAGYLYLFEDKNRTETYLKGAPCPIVLNQMAEVRVLLKASVLNVYFNGSRTPALTYNAIINTGGKISLVNTAYGNMTKWGDLVILDCSNDYSSEFISVNDIDAFSGNTGDTGFKISNGSLVNTSSSWQVVSLKDRLLDDFISEFKIKTDGSTRFAFGSYNIWVDRYYLHFDFPGDKITLVDGRENKNETTLTSVVAEFTPNQAVDVRTEFLNGTLSIYLNGSDVPVLHYSGLEKRYGNAGFINTQWGSGSSIDRFSIKAAIDSSYTIEGGYRADFSDDSFFHDFSGNIGENSYQVSGGVLKNTSKAWQSLAYNKNVSGFQMTAALNVAPDEHNKASARIAFYSQNVWTDRYYLQIDFDTAMLYLVDGRTGKNDTVLSSARLDTSNGYSVKIKIEAAKNGVCVFLNDSNSAAIDFMELEERSGQIAFVNTAWGSSCSVSELSICEFKIKSYDANNDGVINILDLIKVKNHLIGKQNLSRDGLLALKSSGEVSLIDLLLIKKSILFTTNYNSDIDLLIGWDMQNITPSKNIQMPAVVSTGVHSDIYATALALHSPKNNHSIIMVSVDVCRLDGCNLIEEVTELVEDDMDMCGFDPENLLLFATHTHSAPWLEKDAMGENTVTADEYIAFSAQRIALAAKNAWVNMSEGSVSSIIGGSGFGWNRIATYSDGTSEMYGDTARADFAGSEGEDNQELGLVYFYDNYDELTGIMVNTGFPMQTNAGKPELDADIMAPLREEFQDIYILGSVGAAGDQCPYDLYNLYGLKSENFSQDNYALSEFIAAKVIAEINRYIEDGTALSQKSNSPKLIHAVDTVSLPQKNSLAENALIGVHTILLDDLAISTNPFELYTAYGREIQRGSNAEKTMVIQLTSDLQSNFRWLSMGYLPTAFAEGRGGYGSLFEHGQIGSVGGQKLVTESVRLINTYLKS